MDSVGTARLTVLFWLLYGTIETNSHVYAADRSVFATVEVLVTAGGVHVEGATVFLDLDVSGAWDHDLDEPVGVTNNHGVVIFTDVTAIEHPQARLDEHAGMPTLAPDRLVAGALHGNPAAESLTIAYATAEKSRHISLEVFNLRGARVGRVSGSGDLSLVLARDVPSGVYSMRLVDGLGHVVGRRFTRVGGRPGMIRARFQPEGFVVPGVCGLGPDADKNGDLDLESISINVIVDHPGHPTVIQPEEIVEGFNRCTVEIEPWQAMRFMVYGDTHAGYVPAQEIHEAIVATAFQYQPELIVHLGDMVHGQNNDPETSWGVFHEISGELTGSMPFLPTVGNHDVRDGGLSYYFDYFDDLPNADEQVAFYHVEHPLAVFLVLDVDSYGASSNYHGLQVQLDYADAVLQQCADKPYVFVSYHIPAYTGGARGPAAWARAFGSLFVEHQVSAVFSGHTHGYERFFIDGLDYVVAGGGGGIPHAIGGDNYGSNFPIGSRVHVHQDYHYLTVEGNAELLTVTAWDLDGNAFDSFVVMARQPGLQAFGGALASSASGDQ